MKTRYVESKSEQDKEVVERCTTELLCTCGCNQFQVY